jgi:DNA-binding response OmpR family regulator
MRRGAGTARHVLEVDDLVVDELAHTVRCRDAEIELTSLEFSLLTTLLRHQNQVLSKVQLLDEVWGFEHYDVNLVEVHVSALRRKLEAHIPRIIHTVRGAGYVVRAAARRPVLVPTGT